MAYSRDPAQESAPRQESLPGYLLQALQEPRLIDRVGIALLLLVPLALFLGRAAADVVISLTAIVFLARSFAFRDFAWLRSLWVRAALLLWAYWLVRALFEAEALAMLKVAGPWVRFPVFGAAAMVWLSGNRRALELMVAGLAVGVAVMSVWMFAESVIEYPLARLSGPYSNPYPPLFFGQAALAVFSLMLWRAKRAGGSGFVLIALAGALALAACLLAGGRADFLVLALAIALQVLWADRWPLRRMVAAAAVLAAVLGVVLAAHGEIRGRFTGGPVSSGADAGQATLAYQSKWVTGIKMGQLHPVFGVGPGGYKLRSGDPVYDLEGYGAMDAHISKHPHQAYIQIFAEGGLVGLALFVGLAAAMWKEALTAWRAGRPRWEAVYPAAAVLVYTFPLQPNMSVFSQINEVMNWTMLGLAFACVAVVRAADHPTRDGVETSHATA